MPFSVPASGCSFNELSRNWKGLTCSVLDSGLKSQLLALLE
jgi:hypothetical protein